MLQNFRFALALFDGFFTLVWLAVLLQTKINFRAVLCDLLLAYRRFAKFVCIRVPVVFDIFNLALAAFVKFAKAFRYGRSLFAAFFVVFSRRRALAS